MPDVMALVASPTVNVWRDPNVMSTSQVTASLTSVSSSDNKDGIVSMECKPLLPLPPNLISNLSNVSSASSVMLSNIPTDQETALTSHQNTQPTQSELLSSIPSQSRSSISQCSDGESSSSNVKDENGHEIACVVCGDKSSGKHYGQFTCEGNIYTFLGFKDCYFFIINIAL